MKVRVVINEPYNGIVTGGSLRYIGLLTELAKNHLLRVFLPAGEERLKADIALPVEAVCPGSQPVALRKRAGVLALLRSWLLPTSQNIVIPGFNNFPALDRLIAQDTQVYDGEIFFDISSIISYGRRRTAPRVICDFCDSKLRGLASPKQIVTAMSARIENYIVSNYFKRIKRHFIPADIIITAITDEDCRYIRATLPNNIIVSIPNGVPPTACDESRESLLRKLHSKTFIFAGTLNFTPNVDAIERLIARIWPIIKLAHPAATLQVVGRNPCQEVVRLVEESEDVNLLADVESVLPFLQKASAAIIPVFIGSGMKNKVLEALVCGTPVVGTQEAATGIGMCNGIHGFLELTEEAIAKKAIHVLNMPPSEYADICKAARTLALTYSWSASAMRVSSILKGEFAY